MLISINVKKSFLYLVCDSFKISIQFFNKNMNFLTKNRTLNCSRQKAGMRNVYDLTYVIIKKKPRFPINKAITLFIDNRTKRRSFQLKRKYIK